MASAPANQWVQPFAKDSMGNVITNVTPGQVFQIYVGNHQPVYAGTGGNLLVSQKITFASVTGGTVDLPQNIYYTEVLPGQPMQSIPIHSLPFVEPFVGDGADSAGYNIYVQAGQLNNQGKAPPVVMKINMTIANTTGDTSQLPASVDESGTITLPVEGSPALFVNVKTTTTEPTGILYPGERATYDFQTEARGLTMQNVTFKASVPAGTTLTSGSIFPSSGVYYRGTIVWISQGDQTSFDCGFAVQASAHPGTKTAVVNYNAATRVLNKALSKSGSIKIPIKNFGEGKIDYLAPNGAVDGDVAVDAQCTYRLTGWDWNGGSVLVKLNGLYLGAGSEQSSTGPFVVPVFTSANLESVLSAEQTGNPIDTIVTGAPASTAELVSGSVEMVDANGTVARNLARQGNVAVGEVDPSDIASPSRLGHLQLGGANSAVVLHYLPAPGAGSDLRLIFARGGDVKVFGSVRASEIEMASGASEKYNKQNLTSFDTSGNTGVQNLASSFLTTSQTLGGYCYAASEITITGNITLDSPIAYFAGNVTIAGTAKVAGSGTIIVIGDLTVQSGGKLAVRTPSGFALGVGGKLIIEP